MMNKQVRSTLAAAMLPMGMSSAIAQSSGVYSYLGNRNHRSSSYTPSQLSHALPFTNKTINNKELTQKVFDVPAMPLTSLSLTQTSTPNRELTLLTEKERIVTDSNVLETIALKSELQIAINNPINELIIIDAAVPDKYLFYNAVKPGTEIKEISSGQDGLVQLNLILANYQNLDALHIVSHADDGVLYLGNSHITQHVLQQEMNALAALDSSLKDGADLLLYACDLAKTDKGEQLLELIANSANIDVTASNNLTGSSALGGDWELEVRKGDIESEQFFSRGELKDFSSVLALSAGSGTITMEGFTPGYSANPSYDAGDGFTVQFSTSSNNGQDLYAYGAGGGYVSVDSYGNNNINKVYTSFTNAESFDVTVFEITNHSGGTQVFRFTSDLGHSFDSSVADSVRKTISLSGFTGITKLTVAAQGGGNLAAFHINSMTVANVTAPSSNTAPITSLPTAPTVNEDDINVAIANDINITDADTDNQTVTLTITGGTASIGTSNLSFTTGDGANDSAMVFSGTLAHINIALDAMTFTPTSNLNGTNAAAIQIATNDGNGGSDDDTLQFDISAVNDDPIQTGDFPADINVVEDTASNVDLSGLTLSDVDADTSSVVVTLTASQGSLTASSSGGVTIAGSGSSAMSLTGTISNIDSYLNTTSNIQYTGLSNDYGNDSASLAIKINDGGNIGTGGGADIALGTSNVDISAINDAPTDIALTSISINQNATGAGGDVGVISSIDVDSSSFSYSLKTTGTTCTTSNGADNSSFQINADGETFETSAALAAGSYSVCLQTYDGSATYQEVFSITVNDNAGPSISSVSIPNSNHKVGDIVTATITVTSDSDDYTTGSGGISGTISGYALGSLSKTNDTTYTATFTITDGGTDVAAGSNVVVNFTLNDSSGNTSSAYATAISQSGDAIYANLPDIDLTTDVNTIAEDGGVSTLTATLSGSLNNQWPEDITVGLAYSGTGTAGTDYSKSDSIVISTGSSSNTATVTGTADTLFDAAIDETVIVDISTLSVGNEGTANQQTVTITDAESAPAVTLSVGSSPVAENAGTSTITASLDTATFEPVTVNLAYTGTATSGGTDYNSASSSITIPAGATSANAVTGITAVDDALTEGNETIIIDISSISGGRAAESGTQQQTITITDDEDGTAPTITAVSIPNADHKVGDTVTATITVTPDGDDYTTGSGGISGTISGYALGSLSKTNDTTYTATFTITDGGTDVAAGSNVVVNFTLNDSSGNTSSAYATAISQSGDAIYANLPDIDLTTDVNTIAEDGGVSTLTATLSGSLNNQWPEDITVGLAYSGTGTAGTDYSKSDSIVISTGSSSNTATVTGTADTLFDAAIDETVIVDISTLSVGNEGSTNQQTLTITDAESAPTVTLSVGSSPVAENGGTSTITATLDTITYADVIVNLAYSGTATSDSDYNTPSSSITITAGSLTANAITGITAVDDNDADGDQTIIIDVESVNGGSASENGTQQQTITITDDDDGTAPVFDTTPSLSNITATGADLSVNMDEEGKVYYLIVDSSATTPTAAQVKSGASYSSVTVYANGNITTSATTGSNTITGLSDGINYDVYIAGEDSVGNLQSDASVVRLSLTTLDTSSNINSITLSGTPAETATSVSFAVVFGDDVTNVTTTDFTATLVSGKSNVEPTITSISGSGATYNVTVNAGVTIGELRLDLNANTDIVDENSNTPDAYSSGVVHTVNTNNKPTVSEATSNVGPFTIDEDIKAALDLSDILIADGNDDSLIVTISVGNGLIFATDGNTTVNATTITGSDSNGSSNITLMGLSADINAFLNDTSRISFQTDENDTASVLFTITANDNLETSTALTETITINAINDAPTISGTPTTTLVDGNAYSFTPTANDIDGDTPLTFIITNKPDWAAFDSDTGALTGVPQPADVDTTVNIVIRVEDPSGEGNELAAFDLEITSSNSAPVISGTPLTTTAEDAAYRFTPTVTDVDSGDIKVFSITNKPSWATFSSATGELSGIPSNSNLGTTNNITITVTDGIGAQDSLTAFNLTVTNVNDAPVISGTPAITVAEDVSYSFTPAVTDVDSGDTKTFSISNKPSWATFSTATGLLSGTPTNDNIGTTSNIIITVTDGSNASASLSAFSLTVTNENDAPVITGSPTTTIAEDAAYNFTPTVTDVDSGDTKTFSISNKPSWATFNTITGELSGTPTNTHVGTTSSIVITVKDGSNVTDDLAAFSIEVTNVNDAPVISASPITLAVAGVAYGFTASATDVDNTPAELTYSLSNQPSWLTINAISGVVSGTPTAAEVDVTTSNITVSVSDGSASDSLSFSIAVDGDLDGDQIGDDVDSDIDGDGMSNEFELANGLEPLDASDASLDLDGDGVTNLDEYLAGTDPTRDDYAPVFTAPEDLIGDLAVNATGLFTKVSLVVPAVEDGKDGILLAQYDLFACVSEDDAVGKSAQTHFAPGCYNILWSAVDAAGNNANLTQKLHVIPLVEFSKNQDTAEEGEVSFDIILNGQAAIYPVTIPFTISGTAVNPEDHNLTDRSVSLQKITGAVKGETTATVTFDVRDDGVGEGTENITVTMNQPTNAVIGAKDSHTITIYEENVAPTVRFSATATVTENSVIKRIIHNDDDEFTIHAVVADPNTGDNHSYDWSSSDGALGDIDSTNSLFTINPADLATGSYKLVVQISDGEKTAMVETSLRVIKDVIALGSSDSDGDGISDESEGLTDSDLDGIPDYLDHIALASNVIQEIRSESAGEVINSQAFLMETEAGLSLRLGHVAFNSGSTSQTGNEAGSSVSAENIAEFHEVGSGVAEELTRYNFDNGIFNFIVDDLPVAGQSVNIVVAQFKAIPADAIYRKLMPTGWVDFTENANNQLSSAPGEKGYCPPPGNVAYVAGLTLDHWCVQLTIEDGGPNDADGEINGAVNDPGGVATALFEPIEVTTKGKGGAGSMSESLVILLGLLALARGVMQSKTGTTYWRVLQYSLIAMAIMLKSAQAADSTLAENIPVSTTTTVVTATPIDQEHQGGTTPTTMALEKNTQKRFYIGMSVLAVKSEERNDDFERELTQLGLDAQVSQSDLSRPGLRGYIGLQTTPWLAFELGYVNLGQVETTLTGQAIDANGYLDSAQQVYPVTADAGVLDMIFNLALTDHISGVLQVGKMRWASKYELSSGAITREFDDSGWGTHYGAGVEVEFVTALPVYFGWNRYDFANTHVDAWEFGIKYRF